MNACCNLILQILLSSMRCYGSELGTKIASTAVYMLHVIPVTGDSP